MSIKVGINGFGRIGRMVVRASVNHPEIEVVGINDLCPADYLAYLMKYANLHGRFQGTGESTENSIIVNGHEIPISAERNPADLPWGKLGAEYVVESTGLFLTQEKAAGHLTAGAKKVIMSAPSEDASPRFVCGGTLEKCPPCGLCRDQCPMGAIGEDCTSIDSSRCISCFRCVKRCPVKAKGCFTPEYESFAQAFSQRLKEPRENQYFLPR